MVKRVYQETILFYSFLVFILKKRVKLFSKVAFEKIVVKRKKIFVTTIFSFSTLLFPQQILSFDVHSVCCLQMLSSWRSLGFRCTVTLSQTSSGFNVSAVQVLKALWEKDKLLVMSNFSFSHSVFYPFVELPSIFIKFRIVVCTLFKFGKV